MNDFLLFIIIAMSILNLILFFKIWKMTNDTAKIKNTLDIILNRKLSNERRIKQVIEKTYARLHKNGAVSSIEDKEVIQRQVSEAIDKDKAFLKELFDDYNVSDVYNIEELKKDATDRIIKENF